MNAVTVDEDICADFGFDVTFVENGTFKTRTFYDREGNEVKTILSNFDVRFTSTATANGKTLSTNYPLVFITRDGADIRVGLRNAYHVPEEGLCFSMLGISSSTELATSCSRPASTTFSTGRSTRSAVTSRRKTTSWEKAGLATPPISRDESEFVVA